MRIKKRPFLGLLLVLSVEVSSSALVEIRAYHVDKHSSPVIVQGQTQKEGAAVQLRAELVLVPVQVLNKKTGRPAEGEFGKEDFLVFEDGVPQHISFFGRDDLPLSVLLLIETYHWSEIWHYREIFQGVQKVLERLGPEDEVALMTFNGEPRLVQEFTRDRDQLYQRLLRLEAQGAFLKNPGYYIGSLLYTAILEAARYMLESTGPKRRRALIVFTYNVGESLPPRPFRGEPDVFEKRRMERWKLEMELLDVLYGSDIVVCGVIIGDPRLRFLWGLMVRNEAKVDKLVEITGGRMITAKPERPVRADQLVRLIDLLRAQYVLGYVPTAVVGDGRVRTIKVELSASAKKKYKDVRLRHRRGYIAAVGKEREWK
jgi:VWFA-related protein